MNDSALLLWGETRCWSLSGFKEWILLSGERHYESKRFYSRTQHNAPARSRTQTFLHLESSILTTEPPVSLQVVTNTNCSLESLKNTHHILPWSGKLNLNTWLFPRIIRAPEKHNWKEQLSMRKTKWILSKRKLQQNNYTVKFISSLQNLPDLNTVDSVISFPLTNVRLFSQGIIFTTPAINRARAQMLIMAVSSSSFFFDCSWRCQQCYLYQNTKS